MEIMYNQPQFLKKIVKEFGRGAEIVLESVDFLFPPGPTYNGKIMPGKIFQIISG